MSALYLIPVTLGDVEHRRVLPEYNREVILSIRHFIVENVRTARRFLKKTEPSIVIDNLVFYELNKHTSAEAVAAYLAPLAEGESVGVISEAAARRLPIRGQMWWLLHSVKVTRWFRWSALLRS